MTKQIILTEQAPKPLGPYSQAVEAGGFIFCAGQIPIDPQTGRLMAGSVRGQTERILANLKAVLAASGSSLDQTVKLTVYLTNMADFENLNPVLAKHFVKDPPARAVVQVAALPRGASVEMDLIALKK